MVVVTTLVLQLMLHSTHERKEESMPLGAMTGDSVPRSSLRPHALMFASLALLNKQHIKNMCNYQWCDAGSL